jgi:hypothetical protein
MLETLLRTKLFVPPLRPNLVARPRLVELLNQGLQLGHKLTLVSALAGYGKTSLIGEWLAGPGAEIPMSWQIHRSWIDTRWPSRFQRATFLRPGAKAYA